MKGLIKVILEALMLASGLILFPAMISFLIWYLLACWVIDLDTPDPGNPA